MHRGHRLDLAQVCRDMAFDPTPQLVRNGLIVHNPEVACPGTFTPALTVSAARRWGWFEPQDFSLDNNLGALHPGQRVGDANDAAPKVNGGSCLGLCHCCAIGVCVCVETQRTRMPRRLVSREPLV
jgi:hypothetical protein